MKYNSIKDPIRIYNEILGGKWRLLILFQLFSKTQRFKDLHQNIEGITPRMLTKELRTLEKYNLVEKEVYREVPPRVEYSLTDDGIKLFPLIESIQRFGENFGYLIDENEYPRPEKIASLIVEDEKIEFEMLPTSKKEENSYSIIKEKANESFLEKIEEPNYKSIAEKSEKIKKPKVEKPQAEEEKKVVQLELF